MADKENKEKGKILKTALEGKMRFEFYADRKSHIVTFKGNKEIFWVEYETLKAIMDEFDLLYTARTKKPVAVYTSSKNENEKAK